MGMDGGLPLPLPQSPSPCACAPLAGVSVERIYLSGSVRESSDVRLFPEEASDIDLMLQLGPVHVEDAWPVRPAETNRTEGGPQVLTDQSCVNREAVSIVGAHQSSPVYDELCYSNAGACCHEIDEETYGSTEKEDCEARETFDSGESDDEGWSDTSSVLSDDEFQSCEDIPDALGVAGDIPPSSLVL